MNPNLTKFDLCNKSIKQSERETNFSSKKVLSKVAPGERRASAFKLENVKK